MNIQKYSGSLSELFSTSSKAVLFLKIGGSSLKNLQDIIRIVDFLRKQKPNLIVLSALYGVTSKLERIADLLAKGQLVEADDLWKEVADTHIEYAQEFDIKGIEKFFEEKHRFIFGELLDDLQPKDEVSLHCFTSTIMCVGEKAVCRLFQPLLRTASAPFFQVNPEKTIYLTKPKTAGFGDAGIHLEPTLEKLGKEICKNLAHGHKVLLPGFIAKGGNLGRNGSDTTLALAAVAYCHVSGSVPRVVYVKEHPFESSSKEEIFHKMYKKWIFFTKSFKDGEQPYIHLDAIRLLLSDPQQEPRLLSFGSHQDQDQNEGQDQDQNEGQDQKTALDLHGPGFSIPFQILANQDSTFDLRIVSCTQYRKAMQEWSKKQSSKIVFEK